MSERVDIAVVGAGAAGLMAAIWAGRTAGEAGSSLSITALDGAAKIGAKVLVAGGGRCNVTHYAVDESAFAGSTRPAIRRVLGRFGVDRTVAFFRDLGVELKREDTGKLFPTTDDAHTVVSALLRGADDAGVRIRNPWRVASVERTDSGFHLRSADTPSRELGASRLILATGGRSLPKTGSDGAGYEFATFLGHTVTRTFPALVPLTLPKEDFLCSLSGIALSATLTVTAANPHGKFKPLATFTNSTLLTHFGLSGPAALDISRYYLDARSRHGEAAHLFINFIPGLTTDQLDGRLHRAGRSEGSLSVHNFMSSLLPGRLARALCEFCGIDPASRLSNLTVDRRRGLALSTTSLLLPITGDRGFTHAEVTAGGIPLSEVHLDTMESRCCPGLHLCGEILDVDGRIGGFNFQWAWASGFLAGSAAAHAALVHGRGGPGGLKSGSA